MSWSYDPSNLDDTTASGRLNVVRLLIGDNDTTDQQMQDEEVNFSLSSNSDNTYDAAIWCCATLASKYARLVTTELDGALKEEYSDLSNQYRHLGELLEKQKTRSSASLGVEFGGTTAAELENSRDDTTKAPRSFWTGQWDYINRLSNE